VPTFELDLGPDVRRITNVGLVVAIDGLEANISPSVNFADPVPEPAVVDADADAPADAPVCKATGVRRSTRSIERRSLGLESMPCKSFLEGGSCTDRENDAFSFP